MARSLRSLLLLDACHAGYDLIKSDALSLDVIQLHVLLCNGCITGSILNVGKHLNQMMASSKTEGIAHLLWLFPSKCESLRSVS